MKKYQEALTDCDSALSIDLKCTKSITQKVNALLGLERFDEARECCESLRSFGENESADNLLKKLLDVQETDFQRDFYQFYEFLFDVPRNPESFQSQFKNRNRRSQNESKNTDIRSSAMMLIRTDNEILLEILNISFIPSKMQVIHH